MLKKRKNRVARKYTKKTYFSSQFYPFQIKLESDKKQEKIVNKKLRKNHSRTPEEELILSIEDAGKLCNQNTGE